MRRRRNWLVGAVLLVASACSSGSGTDEAGEATTPDPPATPTTQPTTDAAATATATSESPATTVVEPEVEPEIDATLVAVGDLYDDEGVLPLPAALQIFAATIAPLPGVEPLLVDGEAPEELAATAIRRMSANRDQLTAEQTVVFDEALALPDGVDEVEIEVGATRARPADLTDAPTDPPDADELRDLIDGVVGTIEANSGHTLSIPIRASVVPRARTGGDAITTATGPTSSPTGCRILFPLTLFGSDSMSTMSTIAHEVWHCFQADIDAGAFYSAPEWIIEGQAEWAGEAYVGGSSSSAGPWNTWLLQPQRRLMGRSYDAIGLYGVAEATGSDPWGTMPVMLGRSGNAAVETLFGGTTATVVVRDIATALARVPEMGNEWESFGPGITGAEAAAILAVADGESMQADLSIGRFGALPAVLAVSGGEILRVGFVGGTAGAVAMPGAGTISAAPGETVSLCMRPEGCVCPDGSDPFGAGTLPSADYGEGAAALGGIDAGDVSITAQTMSLEEACTDSLVGVWVTTVRQAFQIMGAPYGGSMPTCDGPFTVTFTEDGRWSTVFQATCLIVDTEATANAELTGAYTSTEETFTVTNSTGRGQMTIFGQTQPIPIVDGYAAGMSSPVSYSINAGVLSYSFTAPDGNTFTFNLTRAE